jgi:hypothetical protein
MTSLLKEGEIKPPQIGAERTLKKMTKRKMTKSRVLS